MEDWSTADYWFADYLERLQASRTRTIRLLRERVSIPAPEQEARSFTEKTEQLRRYLAGEREKDIA